ncbi:MAG: hypothetical protein K2N94_07270 [Lachnospiraceae bacterium]|nr:hypothetical protein [Lachnospiraceae bacterium]
MEEIFKRAYLQNICDYLISGASGGEVDQRPYDVRLKEKRERAFCWFKERFPELSDYEDAMENFVAYEGEVESVYMEIGLQVGLFIAAQMCGKMIEGDSSS